MRTRRTAAALGGIVLTVTLSACGSADSSAGPPDSDEPSSSGSAAAAGGQAEQITPGGIALVVTDHLGDKVRRISTFEAEPGAVSVMVQLRDRTAHNFAVSVYSPDNGEMAGAGKAGRCPPKRQLGEDGGCRVLDNGTTVMTNRTPYGFSDDNKDGVVIFGSSSSEKNGAGMVMYESYDKTPAVSEADIDALLGDERLGWLTDPAVNAAGADVPVQKMAG